MLSLTAATLFTNLLISYAAFQHYGHGLLPAGLRASLRCLSWHLTRRMDAFEYDNVQDIHGRQRDVRLHVVSDRHEEPKSRTEYCIEYMRSILLLKHLGMCDTGC